MEGATFTPKINKSQAWRNMSKTNLMSATGLNQMGMLNYFVRQEQARDMKAEQEQINKRVFRWGKNWQPTQTVPKMPRIKASPEKVSMLVEKETVNPMVKQNYYSTLQKKAAVDYNDDIVKVDEQMSFKDAKSFLRGHILSLDI